MWNLEDESWDQLVEEFSSSTFYHSRCFLNYYESIGQEVMRLSFKQNGEVVTLLPLIVKKNILGVSILSSPGGPIGELDTDITALFDLLKRKLRSQFILIRAFSLLSKQDHTFSQKWKRSDSATTTGISLKLDLNLEVDQLKKNLSSNWRHNLKRSERYSYKMVDIRELRPSLINQLYQEMADLKQLPLKKIKIYDIEKLLKSEKIFGLGYLDDDGKLLGLRACGFWKSQAWDLLAAAGGEARNKYVTHKLLWGLILEAKKRGGKFYELGGVDPQAGRGVYNFKKGTGAQEVEYLGEWDLANHSWGIGLFNFLYRYYRWARGGHLFRASSKVSSS